MTDEELIPPNRYRYGDHPKPRAIAYKLWPQFGAYLANIGPGASVDTLGRSLEQFGACSCAFARTAILGHMAAHATRHKALPDVFTSLHTMDRVAANWSVILMTRELGRRLVGQEANVEWFFALAQRVFLGDLSPASLNNQLRGKGPPRPLYPNTNEKAVLCTLDRAVSVMRATDFRMRAHHVGAFFEALEERFGITDDETRALIRAGLPLMPERRPVEPQTRRAAAR